MFLLFFFIQNIFNVPFQIFFYLQGRMGNYFFSMFSRIFFIPVFLQITFRFFYQVFFPCLLIFCHSGLFSHPHYLDLNLIKINVLHPHYLDLNLIQINLLHPHYLDLDLLKINLLVSSQLPKYFYMYLEKINSF